MESKKKILVIKEDRGCLFCKREPKREERPYLHLFYRTPYFRAHYLCVLTSTFIQPGNMAKDNFFGFDFDIIGNALEKTMQTYCAFCEKENASIICANCQKPFHLPCGVENNCVVEMFGTYIARCEECFLKNHDGKGTLADKLKTDFMCLLCGNDYSEDKGIVYHGECCIRTNYHLRCLRKMAFFHGPNTSCPRCRNKEHFQQHVKRLGVFVSTFIPTKEMLERDFLIYGKKSNIY